MWRIINPNVVENIFIHKEGSAKNCICVLLNKKNLSLTLKRWAQPWYHYINIIFLTIEDDAIVYGLTKISMVKTIQLKEQLCYSALQTSNITKDRCVCVSVYEKKVMNEYFLFRSKKNQLK